MGIFLADLIPIECDFQVAYGLVRSKCGFEDTSDLPWIAIQRGGPIWWSGLVGPTWWADLVGRSGGPIW